MPPLKIAFTSCAEATQFPHQPVWDRIAQARPDHLVLLGDSVYYDVHDADTARIKAMSVGDFGRHAHDRWRRQLDCPEFRALVGRVPTHAIWDDHDFLWNNACGADLAADPQWDGHLAYSRCLFRAFRDALAMRPGPGRMPAFETFDHTVPMPPPGYAPLQLAPGVRLHLTDGRSHKAGNGRKALLGRAQIAALADNCASGDIHVVASGVVFEKKSWWGGNASGETWADCEDEHRALLDLAMRRRRLILLSGDIHDLRFARYRRAEADCWLYEATASGAALPDWLLASDHPKTRDHWGLLTIDDDGVEVGLYHAGGLAQQHRIGRDWA